jgi:hypothetical protein
MKREKRTIVRIVSLVVTMLLLSGWVMPLHSCTETWDGAILHCGDVPESDPSALLFEKYVIIFQHQVLSFPLSQITVYPQFFIRNVPSRH